MRIRDWSSDVCSSDLTLTDDRHQLRREGVREIFGRRARHPSFVVFRLKNDGHCFGVDRLDQWIWLASQKREAVTVRCRPPYACECRDWRAGNGETASSGERREGKGWVRTCRDSR